MSRCSAEGHAQPRETQTAGPDEQTVCEAGSVAPQDKPVPCALPHFLGPWGGLCPVGVWFLVDTCSRNGLPLVGTCRLPRDRGDETGPCKSPDPDPSQGSGQSPCTARRTGATALAARAQAQALPYHRTLGALLSAHLRGGGALCVPSPCSVKAGAPRWVRASPCSLTRCLLTARTRGRTRGL